MFRHWSRDRGGRYSPDRRRRCPPCALCKAALKHGLSGLEFAYGIPGTVGGAVYMNAGAYGGEMKDVLTTVRYLAAEGEVREVPAAELDLRYRHSIFEENSGCILSAQFHLQPETQRTSVQKWMN